MRRGVLALCAGMGKRGRAAATGLRPGHPRRRHLGAEEARRGTAVYLLRRLGRKQGGRGASRQGRPREEEGEGGKVPDRPAYPPDLVEVWPSRKLCLKRPEVPPRFIPDSSPVRITRCGPGLLRNIRFSSPA